MSYVDASQQTAAQSSTGLKLVNMSLISYLAEDNEAIARNLIETLQEICEVKVVAVGATQTEASQWLALHDTEWDLAIVDLFLKEGSGLGVLAGCRNRRFSQKVVVLTNYATAEIRKRATELGANAVFDKSSELDALFAYCAEQTAQRLMPGAGSGPVLH